MAWAGEWAFVVEGINREFVIGCIGRRSMMRAGYWLQPDMKMARKADNKEYVQIANTYAKKLVQLKPRALPDYATVFMNQN